MKRSLSIILCIVFFCYFGVVLDVNAETINSTSESNTVIISGELPQTIKREVYNAFEHDFDNPNDKGSQIIEAGDPNGTYLLYCSDKTNETIKAAELTKDEKLPYGIAYILMNSYPERTLISGVSGADSQNKAGYCGIKTDEMLNFWITQEAIWGFQGTATRDLMTSKNLKYHKGVELGDSSCDTYTYNQKKIDGTFLWDTYVQKLINEAKSAADPANATLSISAPKKWTKENGVYKSEIIGINKKGSETNPLSEGMYELSLKGAPAGTKVYKSDGTDVTNKLSEMNSNRFYITIPEKEAQKGPKFTLSATTATYSYPVAYRYVDKTTNTQPSVLVGTEGKQITGFVELSIIPDTALAVSSSIYFVGFIILLCGAGIIYVNAKPKKQTNE